MSEYRVPSKDYARQYGELLPELLPLLERVLLEEEPILGESVERFERAFAEHTGTRHAVGIGNGTDALILSLRALGIGPGDEVVTAANTFIATISAIVLVGARAVLVEPDPQSMVLSAAGLEGALTPRTKAVIPVHFYGRLCPMAEIGRVARAAGIAVVEDAAQSHGARDASGRRAGSFGAAGCFSFHPSKNLGAFGDGGIVTTDDERLAEQLRVLRNLGKIDKYDVRAITSNSKLDTLQAALLGLKLPRLDGWNARRRALAARYARNLAGIPGLVLPEDPGGEAHVWHLYVVRTSRRDELRAFLKAKGVNAGLHYPIAPHLQKLDVDLGYRPGSLPITEELARTVLSLPISQELTDEEIDYACARIQDFFAHAQQRSAAS